MSAIRVSLKKVLTISVSALALLSCATPPKTELIQLRWPEPPLTTRIAFVKLLASEQDLGRETTWKETFVEFLTGERPPRWHLYEPMDVAVSDDGKRLYASDFGQLQVFVFDLVNRQVKLWGPFDRPFGLALDRKENLYVVEQASATIHVLDREGKKIKAIRHPDLVRPADIVIDRERGRLYVADPARKSSEEHTVKIFDMEGNLVGKIGEGKGEAPGRLYFPTYLALDHSGNLYVSSTLNARVDVFSPEGKYLKSIGQRGNAFGMFDKPKGIALDRFDNVYVADSGWSNVQIFNQQGQVLLFFGGRGAYPGLLKNPTGLAIDKDNRIYVADLLNYRVTVYQLINTTAEDSLMQLPPQPKIPQGSRENERLEYEQ